jgi:hypothetical protein
MELFRDASESGERRVGGNGFRSHRACPPDMVGRKDQIRMQAKISFLSDLPELGKESIPERAFAGNEAVVPSKLDYSCHWACIKCLNLR